MSGLTLLALVVLEGLEASKGSASSQELVAELGLVVRLVGLTVVVTSLVCEVLVEAMAKLECAVPSYRIRTSCVVLCGVCVGR